MTEKPIIFSTQMVQAILEGRKNQTRRIVKPQPDDDGLWNHTDLPMSLESDLEGWNGTVDETGESNQYKCPYGQPGDVLWVRESYSPDYFRQGEHGYKADWTDLSKEYLPSPKWKPSIHMPRTAARIFLKVENVRVERLQEITASECKKEGILIDPEDPDYIQWIEKFADLWDKINGFRAPWESNPWVWVIEFSRRE